MIRWICPNGHSGQGLVCLECGAPCEPSQDTTPLTSPRELQSTLIFSDSPLSQSDPGPSVPARGAPLGEGYEVLRELGRGGMGVVHLARDRQLNRLVALKMILGGAHASQQDLLRFRAEAVAAAQLQHPNIVQIHAIGEHDGLPFFSLEYVEGGSLEGVLREGVLPPTEAARLVATLARAMHYAHERGIVHRDLKPANVLLASGGREPPETSHSGGSRPPLAGLAPKITDFGLSKLVQEPSGLTVSGQIMGTPAYMAPEQAAGKVREIGPAADVYALGAVLHTCLLGMPPFDGENAVEVLLKVCSEEVAPLRKIDPKIPRDLETICLKCLEKAPRNRYASALELAEDLERFVAGEAILARPVGLVGHFVRWCARQPAFASTLIALTLFYINHLVLMGVGIEGEGGFFHWFVTGLMAAWLAGACVFQRLQYRPGWTSFAVHAWCALEVACLTAFLWQANGPQSSLTPGYLLLIAGAALRGRLGLVWFVAGLNMLGYAGVFLDSRLRAEQEPERLVTPHRAVMFLLMLGIMGVMCHLLVKKSRAAGGKLQ